MLLQVCNNHIAAKKIWLILIFYDEMHTYTATIERLIIEDGFGFFFFFFFFLNGIFQNLTRQIKNVLKILAEIW